MLYRFIIILLLYSFNVNAAPYVVASIKPFHSIVAALTENIYTTKLLLNSNQDAHNFHLKTSQISHIKKADILIIVDPHFESGLKKIIASISTDKTIIIADISKIHLLKNNENSYKNYHLWLNINNMKVAANSIARTLIEIDPLNHSAYNNNLQTLLSRLEQLDKEIKSKLSKIIDYPIATYSNTFQYFLKSNKLQNPVMVTKYHGDRLSLYEAIKARKSIKKHKTSCMLSDIDVPNARIDTITSDLGTNNISIDVMGYDIEDGPEHYFKLMSNITDKVVECLQ